jgi:hypothetical protein
MLYSIVKHVYRDGESEPYGFYRKAGPYPNLQRAKRHRDIMENDHPAKDWKGLLDIVEEGGFGDPQRLYYLNEEN